MGGKPGGAPLKRTSITSLFGETAPLDAVQADLIHGFPDKGVFENALHFKMACTLTDPLFALELEQARVAPSCFKKQDAPVLNIERLQRVYSLN
jgi:hypothetical protein